MLIQASHSLFKSLSFACKMKLIILVVTTMVLMSSYLHDAQAASVSCTGRYYPKIYVFNSPYASTSAGEYTLTATEYNNAPVYQHGSYSLYRRQNGYWYLDFNEISEDYAGSISYSDDNDKGFPWQTGWKGDTVVLITKALFVYGVAYGDRTDGKYETDGTMNQGYPVYTRNNAFFVYRRSNGKWYHTFEKSIPDSGGALAYGEKVVSQPWESTYYPSTVTILPLLECEV